MTVLSTFEKFMLDHEAEAMYITGVAGTGKTTSLREVLEYCIANKLVAVTTAYTHKAVNVLADKLPQEAVICTLHSYLKKRPSINDKALKREHVDINTQLGLPEHIDVLLVDEFSMIGEKDYMSIVDLLWDENGKVKTKVVFIGDPNQLPPVKDMQTIVPGGDYWVKLTKIHRQADDSPLVDTLIKLNSYIDGAIPEALEEHEAFERGFDLPSLYEQYATEKPLASKIILAYTNAQVQALNAQIQGRAEPHPNDKLFSPTLKKYYTMCSKTNYAIEGFIETIRGDMLEAESKYKTLEVLERMGGIDFYTLEDEEGNFTSRAVVFGHGNYQERRQELGDAAVKANKAIEKKFKVDSKEWSKENWPHELAKARAKAWREYMAFKDCVICLDFPYAMTVHKSQGSTYDYIFLDIEDLGRCADKDYTMYLRLLYVALSRASLKVFTN